jgi:hypothetical protein
MSTVPVGVFSANCVRPGSKGSVTVVISEAVVPSTIGWPLPMKTLVEFPSATVVTLTLLEISSIRRSRWSSRSLGVCPVCCMAVSISPLSRAMPCAISETSRASPAKRVSMSADISRSRLS